jgi:hypothetical protein
MAFHSRRNFGCIAAIWPPMVDCGFEVAGNLGNMSANRRFRMAGVRHTPIQVALVARGTSNGIENFIHTAGYNSQSWLELGRGCLS